MHVELDKAMQGCLEDTPLTCGAGRWVTEPGKGWFCVKFDVAVQKLQEGTARAESDPTLC